MDLVALNIQRGRDHGLPSYNQFREFCGLGKVNRWQDLAQSMDGSMAQRLSRMYNSVDDVDLFVGGVLENHLNDALVGPTFACILGEQFRRLKQGDRFWFENGGMESSFTDDQLNQLRKASLARIFCDNSDGINVMQKFAMEQPLNRLIQIKLRILLIFIKANILIQLIILNSV